MGASRKLQGEIDRVLKKVQEGVDVFDSIWNKVYDTENANQKEKFEADLKKEIKKLQRYRDQIKSWIQSSEIKDKKALMDARKLIEKEMERFKVCEKETKTKAFSKEGLGQQPKTDPREKAKSETRDWLNNFVSDLENQIDTFEAEIEGLSIKKGKNRPPRLTHLETSITRHKAHIKKLESILRLLDNDELSPEQVNDVRDFIEDYVERNQDDFEEFSDVEELYSTLPVEKVEALEEMVSSLGPATLAKGATAVPTSKSAGSSSSVQVTIPPSPSDQPDPSDPLSSSSPIPIPLESKTSPTPSSSPIPKTPSSKSSPLPSPSPLSSNPVFSRSNSTSNQDPLPAVPKEDDVSTKKPLTSAVPGVSKTGPPPGLSLNNTALKSVMSDGTNSPKSPMGSRVGLDVAGSGATDGVVGGTRAVGTGTGTQAVVVAASGGGAQWRGQTPAVTFPPQNETVRGRAEIAPDQREQYVQRLQQVQQAKQQQQQQNNINTTNSNNNSVTMPLNISSSQKPAGFPAPSSASQTQAQQNLLMQQANYYQGVSYRPFVTQNISNSSSSQGVTLQSTEISKTDEQQEDSSPKSNSNSRISEEDLKSPRPGSSSMEAQLADLSPGQPHQQPTTATQSNLGVIGRRSATSASLEDNNNFDQVNALQLLEAAFYKLPQPKDSERAKTYVPRHPIVTPASYPQVQSPTVSNPALWERLAYDSLGTDTLFFAFYYQQNSYQQYLAARELKKNSWRYHRKYNTWFQRHEEPKVTTDEFEKGSYVYFDFHVTDDSSGWCQRIKNEFVFEYNYLEDELAV